MKSKKYSSEKNRLLKADLHLHTSQSDGFFPAARLVSLAHDNGLDLISITDHDTVQGLKPAAEIARKTGCSFIPGVELEALVQTAGEPSTIHLLGYGIDYEKEELLDYLEQLRDKRRQRARKILKKLQHFGIELSLESVTEETDGNSVGRVHLAGALKKAGHVRSIEEAFELYIGDDRPAYVAKTTEAPEQVIDLIHSAGGAAVWAHPYYTGNDAILPELVAKGLDGLECYHHEFDRQTTAHYLDLAKKYDLLVTGGSDYHGTLEEDFTPGDWWYSDSSDFLKEIGEIA